MFSIKKLISKWRGFWHVSRNVEEIPPYALAKFFYESLATLIPNYSTHPAHLLWAYSDFPAFVEKRRVTEKALNEVIIYALANDHIRKEIAAESPPHRALFRNWNKICYELSKKPAAPCYEKANTEKPLTEAEKRSIRIFYEDQGKGPYEGFEKMPLPKQFERQ